MGFQVALVLKNSHANAGDVRDDISAQLGLAVSLTLREVGTKGYPPGDSKLVWGGLEDSRTVCSLLDQC